MQTQIIHGLHGGTPLCLFSRDIPANWPEGHRFVPVRNAASITCEGCAERATRLLSTKSVKQLLVTGDADWEVRAAEQELLLRTILTRLERALEQETGNKFLVYGGIAQLIIWQIADKEPHPNDKPVNPLGSNEMSRALVLFRTTIDPAIHAFAGGNTAERRYLLSELLQKLVPTVQTPAHDEYFTTVLDRRKQMH